MMKTFHPLITHTFLHKPLKTLPLESIVLLWVMERSALVSGMAFSPPQGFPYSKKTWTGLWLLSLPRHMKI